MAAIYTSSRTFRLLIIVTHDKIFFFTLRSLLSNPQSFIIVLVLQLIFDLRTFESSLHIQDIINTREAAHTMPIAVYDFPL